MDTEPAEQVGSVVVHRAGSGPGTWAMGSLFEHLVGAADTDGALGVSLVTQPPRIATPLHRHTHESEALFVLEGMIEYRAGDETYEPGTATSCTCRRASRTRSGSAARRRRGSSPSPPRWPHGAVRRGRCARGAMRLPAEGEGRTVPEEIGRWNEVGPRYGLQVVGPPIPE